jgi:hypothetical protein
MKRGVDAYHKEMFADDQNTVSCSCSIHVHGKFETTYRNMLKNKANWGKIHQTFYYLQMWGHEMYRGAVWKGIKQYWKSLGEGHMGDAFERVHIDKDGNWRYGVLPYGIPLDNQALECMNHHNVKEPLRNKQRAVAAQAVAAATQAAGPSPVQSQPALNPKAAAKLPCSSDIAFDAYVDHLRVVSQRTELEIQNETDFNFHKRYSSLEVKEGEVVVVSVVFVRAPMPLYKKKQYVAVLLFQPISS